MNVRQVDTSDPVIALLLDGLQRVCLPGDEPLETNEGWWWIAYDRGVPIGFGALIPSKRWYDCGYMARAGVMPEARGRGLQKKLIRARISKAKRLGYRWLITDTTDNPASSNSLISTGFKLFNPSRPWAYKHSLYWRLKLEN